MGFDITCTEFCYDAFIWQYVNHGLGYGLVLSRYQVIACTSVGRNFSSRMISSDHNEIIVSYTGPEDGHQCDYRCPFIRRHSSNIRDSADTRLAIIFSWWWRYWPFVTGEFPSQRPVAWSFDVFFDRCLTKWLSNQPRRRWFETLSRSFRRHCAKHLWLSMILVNFWIRCRLYNDRISRNLMTRVKKYIFASSIFSLVYTQCGEAFIPIMCVFHYISIAIYWLEENGVSYIM